VYAGVGTQRSNGQLVLPPDHAEITVQVLWVPDDVNGGGTLRRPPMASSAPTTPSAQGGFVMAKWRIALGLVLALASVPLAARAFQPGSVLFVEPFVGVRQWVPGSQTAPIVISGPPLSDPRGVAVDNAGNVIVADAQTGTFRYSPTGAFQTNMGIWAIDVAVAPSGTAYVVTDFGSVFALYPPYQTQLATGIPDPRGITYDAVDDVILVTSGANGGELLRVLPATSQTVVLATNLGDYIERPGTDRFGNVLVPRNGRVYVLDPLTGAQRGSFASSTIIAPQDVTATSGDRYFVADGDNGGECRIVEIDPITGNATQAAPTTIGANTPWSIAAVPGGTASPTLATGDIVLSDSGAFGGAGGIFRVNPTSGAVRALRLGGPPVALDMLLVGPTRELVTAGTTVPAVHRIDPGTGEATQIVDSSQIGGSVTGAAYAKNGDLLLAVVTPQPPGKIVRLDRASEYIDPQVVLVATVDRLWDGGTQPEMLLHAYRAAPDPDYGPLAQVYLWDTSHIVPRAVAFPLELPFDFETSNFAPIMTTDDAALTPDGTNLYYAQPTLYPHTVSRPGATFSDGGMLTRIAGIAVEETGNVVVADADAFGGGGGVIRLAAANGAQTRVTATTNFVDPTGIAVVPPPSCSDGVDNDGDGLVDYPADPGCLSPDDAWETVDCADGIDNDGDGLIDWDPNGDGPDWSCSSAQFGQEQTQCSDGADNDGDGLIDAADPQCTSPTKNRESSSRCGLLGIEGVGVAGWALGRKARHAVARR
jgi:hypothetical protein